MSRRGFSSPLIIVGIVLLLAAGGVGYWGWRQSNVPEPPVQQTPVVVIEQDATTPSSSSSITILSPNGSIGYSVGEHMSISYCRPNASSSDPIALSHIYLMKGDSVLALITATENGGMQCPFQSIYSWRIGIFPPDVPNQIPAVGIHAGDNYRILVDNRDESGKSLAQSMSAPFAIKATPGRQPSDFAWCLDTRKYKSLIQRSFDDRPPKLMSVPITFINGHMITGALKWDVFRNAIEAALGNPEGNYPEPSPHQSDFVPPAINSQDVILGNVDAPVTILEYGDYYSGFDAILAVEVEPLMREQYINTGKAKLVFRNAPIMGSGKSLAAEAAECARDQGQFWPYRAALFQAKFEDDKANTINASFTQESFIEMAKNLNLR